MMWFVVTENESNSEMSCVVELEYVHQSIRIK